MKVNAVLTHEVSITALDAIVAIKKYFNFVNYNRTFLVKREDGLYRKEDISYHGSPTYEYTLVSNDEEKIALYDSIECIESYIRKHGCSG